MCDKYKPTEEDIKNSNKFWKEYEKMNEYGKVCSKPSLFKRICSAGTFARWWELALVGVFGYLMGEFHLEVLSSSPAIISTLLILWLATFIARLR